MGLFEIRQIDRETKALGGLHVVREDQCRLVPPGPEPTELRCLLATGEQAAVGVEVEES